MMPIKGYLGYTVNLGIEFSLDLVHVTKIILVFHGYITHSQ